MGHIQAAKNWLQAWRLVLMAGALLGVNAGCEESAPRPSTSAVRPKNLLNEIPFPGGTEWLHTCGDNLVAVARDSNVYRWRWDELDKPPAMGKGEGGMVAAFALPASFVTEKSFFSGEPYDPSHPVLLKRFDTGEVLRRWAFGPEVYCNEVRTSGNGQWMAFLATANAKPNVHVGLLHLTSDTPQWVAELEQKKGTLAASQVAPSEDGRYIAVVGIHNGAWVAVADVEAKKVLWNKTQEGAVKFYDVAFSPQSLAIYAGGTSGGLFSYDIQKGEATGRWQMGNGKDAQYGYRITRVAASSDGRLVAAGTGPEGDVYLWNVKTGEGVGVLHTRQSTIMGLTFSPDSARLAVTGVENRTIEIWDVSGFLGQ